MRLIGREPLDLEGVLRQSSDRVVEALVGGNMGGIVGVVVTNDANSEFGCHQQIISAGSQCVKSFVRYPGSGLSVIAAETSLVSPNRHGSLCGFYD
jgi:hypothetical protein